MSHCEHTGPTKAMRITPRNWQELQHYKDRAPVWIKLHRKLLDDFEFHCLPVASRALAPMLWLLSSEYENGTIEASSAKVAFRLRMPESDFLEALKPLIQSGFFSLEQDASNVIAECLPRDREEKEKEKETENAPEKPARFKPESIELPDCIPPSTWEAWVKYRRNRKLSCTEQTMHLQARNLETWFNDGHDPRQIIELSIANGWAGLFPPKTNGNAAPRPDNKALAERLAAKYDIQHGEIEL